MTPIISGVAIFDESWRISFQQDLDKAPTRWIIRTSISFKILVGPVDMHLFAADGASRAAVHPYLRAVRYKLSVADQTNESLFSPNRFPVFVESL